MTERAGGGENPLTTDDGSVLAPKSANKSLYTRTRHTARVGNPASGSIGTLTGPLLINNSGSVVDMGTTNVPSRVIRNLEGNYREVNHDILNNQSIILRCTAIEKTSGIRLITSQPSNELLAKGIYNNPAYKDTNPYMNIRTTVIKTAELWSKCIRDAAIIALDLSNAYARISVTDSNTYIRTRDNNLFAVEQPIQGLSVSGTVAPHMLHKWYARLGTLIRKKFGKSYIGISSYSDNALMVVHNDMAQSVLQFIRDQYGSLINDEQVTIINKDTQSTRVLGLRWKIVDGNVLTIRKPTRALKQAKSYYNHLLGNNRNLIKVRSNTPIKLYCDGVGNQEGCISSAILTQGDVKHPLFGVTRTRKHMRQSLAEAYAIYLGYELISSFHNPTEIPIYTDAAFLVDIRNSEKHRQTPEYGVVKAGYYFPQEESTSDERKRKRPLRITRTYKPIGSVSSGRAYNEATVCG